MSLIEQEILNINDEILKGFTDPILTKDLSQFISSGSKRIRSIVAILYLKMQGIQPTNLEYKILAAGEIIHNASLLHDDVIDEADLRRGKSTIGKRFSPKISILAGDYLLSYAIEKILEINKPEILNLFKDCVRDMCLSEFSQYFLRENVPSKEKYISICEGKTAKLFSTILKSCARLNNLDEETAEIFGKTFGTYFQLKNDLLKVSIEQDKVNGIYTLKDILGIEKTKNLLDNYIEKMNEILSVFPDNIYKEELRDLLKLL